MAQDFLDVISVDVDNVNLEENGKKETVFYKPVQSGKEPYKALVRILPIPVKDDSGNVVGVVKEQPYFMKKRYWLTDEQGNGNYYDSPSTIGEKCPIQTTFFRLYNSDDVREKELAENNFSITTHYWALVYVIDDKQNPELIGKTMIWRFPKEIKKLIEKELEESEYKTTSKVAVWDLIGGKNLMLKISEKKVTIKGKERTFPNYEGCEFLNVSPLEIDGYTLKKGDPKSSSLTKDLLTNAPDISENKYKGWTPEIAEQVNRILGQYSSKKVEIKTNRSDDSQVKTNSVSSSDIDIDNLDF